MSETETQGRPNDQWTDKPMSENQQRARESAALIPVSRHGALPMDFAQMVDYAKIMSTARGAVGAHLNGNVGACLAIMEIAKQFDMPNYAVARQSYLVNGRVAFMGQFYHAIINKYCPLKRKLEWKYEGAVEDGTLKIIIFGTFKDETEARTWESPMIKDIPVKNSPLWKTNPKHQLIYFGVRGWQTVNWPEGMLEIQTDDEAAALEPLRYGADNAIDVSPASAGLRERLAAARAEDGDGPREGHQEGFTDAQFTEIAGAKPDPVAEKTDAVVESAIEAAKPEPAKADAPKEPKASKKKKAEDPKPADPPADLPKTAAEWVTYCRAWLDAEQDPAAMRKRWQGEQKLRNAIGVTSEERDPIFAHFQERLTALEGE